MPATGKSHDQSPRLNVTKVRTCTDAGAIDVCKDGSKVALRIYTREGIFIYRLDLREFTLKCRGAVDHNLNPLPSVEDFAEVALTREFRITPEQMAQGRQMPEGQKEKFTAALADLRSGVFIRKIDAARHHGIEHVYHGFTAWILKQPDAATDGVRPFILKPGGKPL